MKTIGIFYGSSTGNTEEVAKSIATKLGVDKKHVFDVANVSIELVNNYEILFLGASTTGVGDLQDDWDGLEVTLSTQDLSQKQVAVFGMGDSSSYSDSFCEAINLLVLAAEKAGAAVVGGGVDASAYSFDSSLSEVDGKFSGLPLDEDNESELTDARLTQWLEQVKLECSL
ncbi:flavodoxin 2 [Bacteroidales bacterium]|nr:flavodoxin 2 [Bacteroidales bacterium]